MDKLIAFAVTVALTLPLTACVVHTHERRPARAYNDRPRCHPSQYWDGRHCRSRGHHGPHRHR